MHAVAKPLRANIFTIVSPMIRRDLKVHPIVRILSSVLVVLLFAATYWVQEILRPAAPANLLYGVFPSFSSAFALPFCFVVVQVWWGLTNQAKTYWVVAAIAFACILMVEVLHWLDGRVFDLFDILAAGIGSITGTILCYRTVVRNISSEPDQDK